MASGGHKRKASTDLDDTSYPLIPFDDEHQDNNADNNNNNNHHQTLPYNNNNNNNNNNNGCVVNGDEKKDDDIDYNFDFEEEEDGIDQDQENAFAELLKNVDCQQGIIVGNNNKLVIRGPHYYSDNSDGDEPFGKKPKLVTNTIIIDHCTIPICHPTLQNKAIEIKAILEKHVPNVTVKINPFGPIGRINHFEIRIEGGPVLISLKDLRRPFLDVVDLNIKKLLASVKLILNC